MPRLSARLSSTLFFWSSFQDVFHAHITRHFRHCARCVLSLFYIHSTKLASLPFRFKGSGGANMAPIPQAVQHHHRATTKTSQKSFKSKHASKNSIREKAKGVLTHT